MESCKYSKLATLTAFPKKRERLLLWLLQGAGSTVFLLQNKARHNAVEAEEAWDWEQKRKVGRRERGSRSWLGLGGEALELSCFKHNVGQPPHVSGRTFTSQVSLSPGEIERQPKPTQGPGGETGAVQAGKADRRRGSQVFCSIIIALKVPDM